ncbi:hypothetical protein SFRURICE_015959, partial [Spodoptera frugiperda]
MMKSSQGYLYYYPLISYILPINKKIHCFVGIFQKKKHSCKRNLNTNRKPRPPIHHFIIMMKSSQGYLYYYPLISYILPINKKIHCFVGIFQKKKHSCKRNLNTNR